MSKLKAFISACSVASIVAAASLFANPGTASAACYYSADKTSSKTMTQQNATLTSTVVYRIGYACSGMPTNYLVKSMKLRVAVTQALDSDDGPFMRVMRVDSDDNGKLGPDHKYWTRAYSDPYIGCTPNANGNCSFTRTEYPNVEVPFSNDTVAFYGGDYLPLGCLTNLIHEFVRNTIYINDMCTMY